MVGAADALATQPLAELLPRFIPGSERLAAGLTGDAPAFSIAKADRLLGWRPWRSWRGELSAAAGTQLSTRVGAEFAVLASNEVETR
jgi:hypothetical protein